MVVESPPSEKEFMAMLETDQLIEILDDMIRVMRVQAGEVQKLITHVEAQTTRMPHASEMSTVLSELAELHKRTGSLLSSKKA